MRNIVKFSLGLLVCLPFVGQAFTINAPAPFKVKQRFSTGGQFWKCPAGKMTYPANNKAAPNNQANFVVRDSDGTRHTLRFTGRKNACVYNTNKMSQINFSFWACDNQGICLLTYTINPNPPAKLAASVGNVMQYKFRDPKCANKFSFDSVLVCNNI